MSIEFFEGAFYAFAGGSFYGPFATSVEAEGWFKGGGPLATRVLDPMGRPWAPTPSPKPRTVPSVPRKSPTPPDPRFLKPPEPRFGGYGFDQLEERQWGWERRHALLRAYRVGATHRELSDFTKLSVLFVCKLIEAAERDEARGYEMPFSWLRDRNLFWDEREARRFVRGLDRSLMLARCVGRDWLFLATPGFDPGQTCP